MTIFNLNVDLQTKPTKESVFNWILEFCYWPSLHMTGTALQDILLRLKLDSTPAPRFRHLEIMGPKTGDLKTLVLAFTHMNS